MDLFELTNAQKNILNLQRFYMGTSVATLCGAVIFNKIWDKDLLIDVSEFVIKKQEALRTRFLNKDGSTYQYVTHDYASPEFIKFDSFSSFDDYAQSLSNMTFETDGSPMYKMTVFEVEDKSGIILSISHLISDAWTFSVLADDFNYFISALNESSHVDASSFEVCSYTDYLKKEKEYLESENFNADREYWINNYKDFSDCGKINDYSNSIEDIASSRLVDFTGSELSSKIDKFCEEYKTSLSVIAEAAMLFYLSRINKENKSVTIGVPVLGRTTHKEKETAGVMISTIPISFNAGECDVVSDLLNKVTGIHRESYRHKRFPHTELLKCIRENGDSTRRLFNVMVSCQNGKTNFDGKTMWFPNNYSEIPLCLHIDNRDSNNEYTFTFDYQKSAFRNALEVELLSNRIRWIISQFVNDVNTRLEDISIIPNEEKILLTEEFNDTLINVENKSVHEKFLSVASIYRDKVALVFEGITYTYGDLDSMSDVLAMELINRGVKVNSVVPIISKRNPRMVVAMLAVSKAGAAYMFVSPSFPKERIDYMFNETHADVVLTLGLKMEIKGAINLDVFDFNKNSNRVCVKVKPEDSCYVVFTSGSTGKPKGAIVTHRNVMNYVADSSINIMGMVIPDNKRGIISVTDTVFDIFVTESILALLNGITIYLASDSEAISQKGVSELISKNDIGIIQTTPTKMRSFMLDKSNLEYLKKLDTIILGGEELSLDLCTNLKNITSAKIHNVYGPVETTVWSSVAPEFNGDKTIGGSIGNTRIYILDEDLNLVPTGSIGEICISGDGVTRGYINNEKLTAEKFVCDPFDSTLRMYRTGDLGIRRADGLIDFCGRRDSQIKLRGLRIELGEIENSMLGISGINYAAVSVITDLRGNQILAGYYTSDIDISESEIRQNLKTKLPSYMVPNLFIRIDTMPMTPSGKISRKDLPLPDWESIHADKEDTYIPPTSKNEKILAEVFAEVLNLKKVGITEDFFEIGGDSFASMEIVSLAESKGLLLSVKHIYEHRSVKNICSSLDSKETSTNEDLSRYPLKRSFTSNLYLKFLFNMIKFMTNFKVTGLSNLPLNSKVIICPNHESDLDSIIVSSLLGKNIPKLITLMAKERNSTNSEKKIFEAIGGIPVDRSGDFMSAINRSIELLKTDFDYLLVFPEGTRSRSGNLNEFKNGASLVSRETSIPILPVCIKGTRDVMPAESNMPDYLKWGMFKKYNVEVNFGKVINPDNKTIDEITRELKDAISNMKQET